MIGGMNPTRRCHSPRLCIKETLMKRTICSGVVALMLAAVPGFAAEAPVPDFFAEAAEAQLEVVGTQRDTNVRMLEMERLQQRLAAGPGGEGAGPPGGSAAPRA